VKEPPKPPNLSPEDIAFIRGRVIFEDAAVLAFDKPAGLSSQGGRIAAHTLDDLLWAFAKRDHARPRLVHRLDRDTSGVLILGRTAQSAAWLAKAFRGREVEKTYWAVVVPQPELPEGRIELALAKVGGPRGERMVAVDNPEDGQRAITEFRMLDGAKRRAAWLELKPYTGRTHQLRVHCAEGLGTPILGDGKYGGIAAHMDGLPNQLHLHARALRLPHPEGGMLEAAAPLPPHMRETFGFFGFEAPKTPKPRHLAPVSKR
jgi:23S rRNA pseudouridine955/2504/2580 synthase